MLTIIFVFSLFTLTVCQKEVVSIGNVGSKQFYASNSADGGPDLSWDDAQKFCQRQRMDLATIENQEEKDLVFQYIRTKYSVYVGATDLNSKGKWYWQNTRQPLVYSNWGSGEPQDAKYSRCAYMSANDGRWKASYCDAAFARPLCQKL